MRIERIQPKINLEVVIPDDLLRFFREVDVLIKQNDDLVTIESDDLIQTEFVYGGLIKEGSDLFGFTYFPEENTRPKWGIELTASEIAEIASGKMQALNLWKCQNPDCGSHFSSANETCFDCDYIDDELVERKRVMDTLSQSLTREDWVKGYLKSFPDAHPLGIIGDYNSRAELGKKWGYFSLVGMKTLVEKLKG
jgi:hypothetical protein